MRNSLIVALIVALMFSCKKQKVEVKENFASFGEKISTDSVLTSLEMFEKYKSLKVKDTIQVKFRSKIESVCQAKGCWMNLELADNQSAFVKFKDYGFFMPLNSADSETIVSGKAFISVESVEELKHYAKDEGKSQAAIDSIIAPKTNYSFLANGVLIKK